MRKRMEAFVRRVDRERLSVEAVAAWQRGARVMAHHWAEDKPRNIYSHTKSFTALAAGIAIAEGRLSLSDRVVDCLPEAVPARHAAGLDGITLRHLLTMSSGFDRSLLMMSAGEGRGADTPDWAAFVLSQPLRRQPGEAFCYSNGDSYLAGRMVEARAGGTLLDYLQDRLLGPMGVANPAWEHCPKGHTFGASGLRLRLEDMMKLGRLCLQNGVWQGRKLVDAAWIARATALQIATPAEAGNPWHMGYGYQFWLSPYPGAYRADGAYGQISMVLPAADAVIGIQCTESERFPAIRTALHEEALAWL